MNAPPLPPPPPALVRPSASSIFSSVSEQLPFNSPRTTFRHPGYPDSDNVLFSLSPIDNGGVHHGTALSACIIFACNVKGYLAASRDAADGDRAYDEILTAPNYYYYPSTPSQAARYPVCPSFEHWVFPADPLSVIPPSWQEAVLSPEALAESSAIPMGCSQMTYAVTLRDQSCRMTGTRDVCQNAHLVPVAHSRWFQRNSLRGFNLNPALSRHESINDIRNGVLLRQDIHTALDAHKFTFAAKHGKLVTHFLAPTSDLGRQFHNCEVRRITDARPEFFFARFALSVFPLVDHFAASPGRVVSKGGAAAEEVPHPPARSSIKRKWTMDLRPRSPAQDDPQVPPEEADSPPPHKTARLWHDQVLSERYDSEEEDREDRALAEHYFPSVFDGSKTPPRSVYESINFYPGQRSVERAKARWIREHPNVYLSRGVGGGGVSG